MRPILPAIALLATLAACDAGGDGTNPVTGGPDGEDDGDTGNGATSSNTLTQGVLTEITENDDGTLTVKNLPFDGVEGTDREKFDQMVAYNRVTGFDAYESGNPTAHDNQRKYYAVFRKSEHFKVGAVGTGDYQGDGIDGTNEWILGGYVERDGSSAPDIALEGSANYSGVYGGVRVEEGLNGSGDIFLVSGNVELQVDFIDPEDMGAVEGWIDQREYFDVNGVSQGVLPTIVLGTGAIDENGFISPADLQNFVEYGDGSQPIANVGGWNGMFGGPNSEEIAGIIFLGDLTASETGVFTTEINP